MRQKGLNRPQLHRQTLRGDGGHVAVAADAVERQLRKLSLDVQRVPVVVAEMDDGVRFALTHGAEHFGHVAVGVGKDSDEHDDLL